MLKKIISMTAALAMMAALLPSVYAEVAFNDTINETYDEIVIDNKCDTELTGLTLKDGAPDGSKYYMNDQITTNKKGEVGVHQFTGVQGLSATTIEDYMWEADVLFSAVGSGFTISGGGKAGTCVRRYDGKKGNTPVIAVQTGSTSFTSYDEIDTEAWYHIQLIGSYGTSDFVMMRIYKWVDGSMQFVNEYENVNKRNNAAAQFIAVEANTGVDNIRITKIGADELAIDTVPQNLTELYAGNSALMKFSATRQGRSITAPAAEWKVFENGSEITDGSVTIDNEGNINASNDCSDKDITVKIISTDKGAVEAEYPISIKAVNYGALKYDTIFITSDNDYVTSDTPLSLNVELPRKL